VWKPGTTVKVTSTLRVPDTFLEAYKNDGKKADGFVFLVTAERTFDSDGHFRLGNDERMSTLVTPTGLPIEGGWQGAITDRFGYGFKTPFDQLVTVPFNPLQTFKGGREVTFTVQQKLPDDLPPGIYRARLDYGFTNGRSYVSLRCEGFARRPFFRGRPTESHIYSPPIPASGNSISGKPVDASKIQPRIPWIILADYNSNGYRGVVAEEDKPFFALSSRNIIQDDVILPLYADDQRTKLPYNLEPQFPTDGIEARSNIPWDFTKGELSIEVTGPDGKTTSLGKAPFVAQRGLSATTRKPEFTSWRPPAYGQYTVKATGWITDIWGNRYEGGGTYKFWIAKRMTLATATFQGQPYPVGNRYGRDIGFAPAVPADVTITATLFPNSDPKLAKTVVSTGKATTGGIFGAGQGMKPLPFDAPGEYLGYVIATYTDKDSHLWVSTMRHAGVVYPEDTPIEAHGKKIWLNNKFYERIETHREGWSINPDNSYLDHINFPYYQGDVLLIASEQQGANKIEPVLNWEYKGQKVPDDARMRSHGVGASMTMLRTSNGLSPHMFPEFITDWEYYYAGAPASCPDSLSARTASAPPTGRPARTASAGSSTPPTTATCPATSTASSAGWW
jgi:hypothetical protein